MESKKDKTLDNYFLIMKTAKAFSSTEYFISFFVFNGGRTPPFPSAMAYNVAAARSSGA
jgi:hypothetical protein